MSIFNRSKINKLKNEVERLNSELEVYRLQELTIRELDRIAKNLKNEVSQLENHQSSLLERIGIYQLEENQKTEALKEIESKVDGLNKLKSGLQENILTSTTKLNEVESLLEINKVKLEELEDQKKLLAEQKEIRNEIERIRKKIGDLLGEEESIKNRILQRQQEITFIESSYAELAKREREVKNNVLNTEIKLQGVQHQYSEMRQQVESQNKLLSEVLQSVKEKREEKERLINETQALEIKQKEQQSIIEQLSGQETLKYNLLKKIAMKIKAFEQHSQKISSSVAVKAEQLKELITDLNNANEALDAKQTELRSINEMMLEKGKELSATKAELYALEKKEQQLEFSITEKQDIKLENDRLEEKHNRLTELISLLEKRRTEVEQGNAELEARFMKLFQKLNRELNEINKKRNVLEQVILKKDKDLDEKDQMLFEKIAALEESERILNIRQVEIESTDQVLNSTREQREYLWVELQKLEDEAIERKSINEDLRLETDLLFKKKSVIEKNFQDLLNTMNQNYSKLKDRNTGFQKEFRDYEEQFDTIRVRISDSMKEVEELEKSISALKLEQEQHKGAISKMMSHKRRIQEEISKHQSILQRYQRIRDKLSSEQSLSKYKDISENDDKLSTSQTNTQIFKL